MIRCIIIDDAPLALDLLEDYIRDISYLKLEKRFTNAIEAVEYLNHHSIDLIFTDIEMPDISGLELVKTSGRKPLVIFTTAYPQFALEGFNLDAVDYLVKPFSLERLRQATDKANKYLQGISKTKYENEFINIKSGHDIVKIRINEILYIEALKDYVKIYTNTDRIVSLMRMKEIIEILPGGEFVRSHRSFIVPVNRIQRVGAHYLIIENKKIPIGAMFRQPLLDLLKEKNIL